MLSYMSQTPDAMCILDIYTHPMVCTPPHHLDVDFVIGLQYTPTGILYPHMDYREWDLST